VYAGRGPKMIVAAKPIEELLNRALNALPVSVDDIILRGVVSEVADRIVELQRASRSLQERYGSLTELEGRLQHEGVSPDDHTLYTDLLEWRAIHAELTELQELIAALRSSELFDAVKLAGAKVRASLDDTTFLDIHFDPTTHSYSYALIDLNLSYTGDKRVFGWDDFPHETVTALKSLSSYPHHFQYRALDGMWIFEESPMRGNVEDEIKIVVARVRAFKMEKSVD
jgi:hypothetical protein